jgi:transcriptional regulator with XRE-family HTH domain
MRPITEEDEARGRRIRELRAALSLTQAEMAARGGIAREHLSVIESGLNKASTVRVRRALAVAASVPNDDLDAYVEGRISIRALLSRRAIAKGAA